MGRRLRMSRTEIWSEHLEDIARAVNLYDELRSKANETIPGSKSDLEFNLAPMEILCGGEKTGWSIDHWDGATWLVIEEKG
jgi:hypothetical protein